MARIGLFGGAFDPPHGAHVALARAAVEQLGLDRLHVAPTGMAWHKAQTLSAAAHRLAMCRLAFGGLPKVFVDDRELRRGGPTYTIDTLTELRAQYPGAELFLQIGADQAAAFHTWRRAGEIVDMAVISIAVRADSALSVERSAFSVQRSAFSVQRRTLNAQRPTPNLQGRKARQRASSHNQGFA